jgi:hypothetical protein
MQYSVTDDFKSNIKEWVLLDNKVKQLTQQLRDIKSTRDVLTDSIKEYIQQNKYTSLNIKISDGSLKYMVTKVPAAFTQKMLKSLLTDFYKSKGLSDEQASVKSLEIFNYILENRQINTTSSIKRITL